MPRLIPYILTYTRLIIGFIIVLLSLFRIAYYVPVEVALLSIGLLTDVFDGIVARRMGISTPSFRRLDSNVDQVFFLSVALAAWIQCPDFFRSQAVPIFILLAFEGATYLICYIRFRKEIATHSIGAKIWTLILFGLLVEILLTCTSTVLFQLCFWLGVITRLEIIAIILTLKKWTNDVPSLWHAFRLRRGEEIKRSKLFNG